MCGHQRDRADRPHSSRRGEIVAVPARRGLATQSLMGVRTVKRHVTDLQARGLLDANLKLTLTDSKKRYWQDRAVPPEKTVKAEVRPPLRDVVASWYGDTPPAIHQDRQKLSERLDLFEGAMKMYGFDQMQINEFWKAVAFDWLAGDWEHFEVFLIRGFAAILKQAQKKHETNGYPYRNCLGLLKLIAQGACRDLQNFVDRSDEPAAAWEARVDQYFERKESKNGGA